MFIIVMLVGLVFAVGLFVGATRAPSRSMRSASLVAALCVLLASLAAGSIRYVGAGEVGIVVKNALGSHLNSGRIIATDGEMGTQASVLRSGWYFWYWPVLYQVKTVPFVEVQSGQVGLVETADGVPLPEGQLFAPEWARPTFQQMLDAQYFLTTGKGMKGKQVSVLTPGKYPLNTELFKVRMVEQTEVLAGEVAVLKANFGTPPTAVVRHIAAGAADRPSSEDDALRLANPGEMGILAAALPPGKYPLNTDAYTVTEIWTTQMIAHYTAIMGPNTGSTGMMGGGGSNSSRDFQGIAQTSQQQSRSGGSAKQSKHESAMEEREITVRTVDGFTFPVDVRLEYVVEPKDAPIVVAKLGDDEGERFRNAINSAVRAIFRNNAEKVRALDYVQQRSQQEEQSLAALKGQMARFGITVAAVRIGNVGDEASLGKLLDTQTQREIAKQEQITTQEQQKAAEQKKLLAKATQESEEEKRLATATYSVKIADEEKKKQVIAAGAEAESIKVKAEAQSQALRSIAAQIGPTNAALMELLKIVGEKNIQITPRVLVNGRSSIPGQAGSETAALVGTLLDQMISREEAAAGPKPAGTPAESR